MLQRAAVSCVSRGCISGHFGACSLSLQQGTSHSVSPLPRIFNERTGREETYTSFTIPHLYQAPASSMPSKMRGPMGLHPQMLTEAIPMSTAPHQGFKPQPQSQAHCWHHKHPLSFPLHPTWADPRFSFMPHPPPPYPCPSPTSPLAPSVQ